MRRRNALVGLRHPGGLAIMPANQATRGRQC
jgi:hypothetical protein